EGRVHGESKIPEQTGAAVRRVWLEPNAPPAYPAAVRALLNADLIVIGPGSLFTSILPNLLVPDLAAALRSSPALKIFICNLSTQAGETDGYSCGDHVRAIEEYVGDHLFDVVIGNQPPNRKLPDGGQWVTIDDDLRKNYPLYLAQVADPEKPGQHMAEKLAQLLIDLLQERTGPLTREEDNV